MRERVKSLGPRARRLWTALTDPFPDERREAIRRTWDSLPPELQVPEQALGQQLAGCGATHQVYERCNFSCTACYLANTANSTPALPMDEVKRQLDVIREHLGPFGNTQITAGEVTLLPVEDLVEILDYCRQIELTPMVMTHGETFRDDPTYLERLVTEGGLDRVAIHIDTTQRGRRGMKKTDTEADIHWIRDEFATLIRRTRQKTGKTLHAAHTFTVTEDNLSGVPDVMRWLLDNADAFRMISFQPTADVGRTRTEALAGREGKRDALWDKVCDGVGKRLNPQPYLFGHPKCNSVGLYWVVNFGKETHLVEVTRNAKPVDKYFVERLFTGGFAGFTPDGQDFVEAAVRLVSQLGRDPLCFVEWPAYAAYRAFTERQWFPRFVRHAALGRPWSIKPFVTVVHNFMSREELDTPEGRARLAACAFRLPVDGRMVSMCELNGTDLRKRLNEETTERLAPKRRRQAA